MYALPALMDVIVCDLLCKVTYAVDGRVRVGREWKNVTSSLTNYPSIALLHKPYN